MVDYANEPPSFQGNSVDVCRQSCIKGEGDPEVFKFLTMCKIVSLPNGDEGGWSR